LHTKEREEESTEHMSAIYNKILNSILEILRREKIVINTYLAKELRKNKQLASIKRSAFRYYFKKSINELRKAKAVKVTRISKNFFRSYVDRH